MPNWFSVEDVRPAEFDLVKLKNSEGKIFYGWWSGVGWDGYKKEEFGKIIEWNFLSKSEYNYN